jgi:hypothetical protein
MTEKLIDGILGECLVFYSGCFNAREYIDERAFVYLELSNFEEDYNTVKQAIAEDWHSQRLPYIREAKKKILNYLQFFPRLERIINRKVISMAVFNGLCNRLLPIMSAVYLARQTDRRVVVFWTENIGRSNIPYYGEKAKAGELFMCTKDIEFVDMQTMQGYDGKSVHFKNSIELVDDNIFIETPCTLLLTKNENIDIERYTQLGAGFYKPISFLEPIFKELRPVPSIQWEIDNFSKKLGAKTIGIHIRRTDGGFSETNFEETDKALQKRISEWKALGYCIFLATDSEKYETYFGDVLIYKTAKKYENCKENVIAGVVDLFLLSKCQTIIGTVKSTFSLVASLIGHVDLWMVSEKPETVLEIKLKK